MTIVISKGNVKITDLLLFGFNFGSIMTVVSIDICLCNVFLKSVISLSIVDYNKKETQCYLEMEMATHSIFLPGKILRTEEHGELQSVALQLLNMT